MPVFPRHKHHNNAKSMKQITTTQYHQIMNGIEAWDCTKEYKYPEMDETQDDIKGHENTVQCGEFQVMSLLDINVWSEIKPYHGWELTAEVNFAEHVIFHIESEEEYKVTPDMWYHIDFAICQNIRKEVEALETY